MAGGGIGEDAREADPALADTDRAGAFPVRSRPAGAEPARAVMSARVAAPLAIDPKESSYTAVPGAILAGKYRVVRVLGQGGGGVVLEAHHEQLDASVAMKLLNPELVREPAAVERFLREARTASRLAGEHVARVLDVGTLASGEPFLVLEYLAGEDLASWSLRLRCESHPPTVEEVIEVITQAAAGVAEAHAAGVVHRDLKPANLFLTDRRRGPPIVKVLDFGVSKFVDLPSGEDGLTTTSTVLGSVLYMSPEQMRSSKHVDHRTDIYALGACLYELLSGAPPHEANSFAELCAKAYTQQPALLTTRVPDLPAGLDMAVDRALRHDPDKRYDSVAELVQALSPFASTETRARMKALFAEHAPELSLLSRSIPSVRPRARLVGVRDDARAAAPPAAPPPRAAAPSIPSGAIISGALFACALAAASFYLWPDVPARRPSTQAPAATPVAAPSPMPAPTLTATAPPAPAPAPTPTPTPAQTAPSASAAPATTATATATPRPRAAPPPRPPPASAAAPPFEPSGSVDNELTITRCVQHQPDGTDRIVPCPR